MLKKLGIVDLIAAVIAKVEENTKVRCYDAVPDNAPSPFYFAEIAAKRPADTKTMFCEVFTVWVHAIASPGDAKTEIYQMIEGLEDALTEDVKLPDHVNLILQNSQGLQTLKQDETKEWHALIAYDFKMSYGFKCKA